MSDEALDRMCAEAMQRLSYYVNRCYGQNIRQMKQLWNKK